jgi:tetratricopeptide (TPR) repeat protein
VKKNLRSILVFVLLLSGIYLYVLPAATIPYSLVILLHLAVGLVLGGMLMPLFWHGFRPFPREKCLGWVLVGLFFVALSGTPLAAATASRDNERARALEAITRANLGLAYLEQGNVGKAMEEFKKVIELFPNEVLGYANLGLAHFRLNQLQEAEGSVRQALDLDPSHADLYVLLGEILQWQGQDEEAIRAYERALSFSPTHIRAHYKLAKLSERQKDWPTTITHLKAIVQHQPQNLAILLELCRFLFQQGRLPEAIPALNQVAALFAGVKEDFLRFLEEALALAEASQEGEAARRVQIFTNLVRGRPVYRQAIAWLSTQALGLPIERFSSSLLTVVPEAVSPTVPVRFRDVTEEAGLPISPLGASSAVFLDADNNGHLDLFVCSSTGSRLFRNQGNRFTEVTAQVGLAGADRCVEALSGDFDNNGALDLYLVKDGANVLYHNEGNGRFTDVTAQVGVGDPGRGRGALFVDLDHDGDLDLFVVNDAAEPGTPPSRLYRNLGNGIFQEVTGSTGIDLKGLLMSTAAFGDLDDDGDLDLFVAGDGARLYTNLRQGRFQDIAQEANVVAPGKHEAVALGDYNNDGFPDIFLAGGGKTSNRLFRSLGGGKFAEGVEAIPIPLTERLVFSNVRFADFDNDGYLDLLLIGGVEGEQNSLSTAGLRLFRNTGQGSFVEASGWLPQMAASGQQASVADTDEDGDLDILLVLADGRIRLLQNNGGNANHWLKVTLQGLKVGNSKNNLHGLGAKVEIKAGPLYQMRLAESPLTHFGLGTLARADLLRVIWPNGEPDILFEPLPDQVVQAEQRLKGSCPFLYTWDGERYTFVTDIHWRNLLGMVLPDGSYAPPDPAKDSFKIPGEKLHPKDGLYSMQITTELWEAAFLDQVKLLAVDHPQGTEVFVNEAFVPPPYPPLHLYAIRTRQSPVAALDNQGNNLLPAIQQRDRIYLANFTQTAYQGYTKEHALLLDLGDLSHASRILLFLHGWLTPFDSSLNLAASQRGDMAFAMPFLEVIGKDGQWHRAIENIGAPAGKDKTVIVDLTGKFPTNDFRVRIVTTMEIYWDEIFFSTDDGFPVQITPLSPVRADLHKRGFSRSYREVPKGPTLFDYAAVTKEPKWRPMEGLYTRHGEVHPLLLEPDDMYVIMAPGDELTAEFAAHHAPALKPGWVRDFVISSEGWLKEAETNGALAQTLEPLVFHGMSRYPYGPDEHYPNDEAHQEFLRHYVTRLVTGDAYREQVRRYVASPD